MLTVAQREALRSVTDALRRQGITYHVTGGMAAISYGATRPLYDIDIEVHAADMPRVRELFHRTIAKDLHRLADGQFDLLLLTLNMGGVPVDINPVEYLFMETAEGRRVQIQSDLSRSTERTIDSITVRVQARDDLVAYKRLLGRPTDLQDVAEMEAQTRLNLSPSKV